MLLRPKPKPKPTAPEFSAALLAISALAVVQKRTPKAAKRCAKRVDRAIEILMRAPPMVPPGVVDPGMGEAAREWFAKRCRVCGACKGRTG